jgi:hypothetical protein
VIYLGNQERRLSSVYEIEPKAYMEFVNHEKHLHITVELEI